MFAISSQISHLPSQHAHSESFYSLHQAGGKHSFTSKVDLAPELPQDVPDLRLIKKKNKNKKKLFFFSFFDAKRNHQTG